MPGKKRKSEDGEAKEATKRSKPEKKNKSDTKWDEVQWASDAKTAEGNKWSLKLSSWNVDGLRACCNKGGAEFLKHESPDVLCFQETKVSEAKLPAEMKDIDDYPHTFWLAAEKDGYSGVGLLSKTKPVSVTYGFEQGENTEDHNSEGRLITAEFDSYFLVTTYVPNAGRGLVTLDKRMEWDPLFRKHVETLDKKKPVIICGDMNVSHTEIDLKNPKTNKKNAGFTQEERDGFTELLGAGFVDSFRHFYPKKEGAYTFWTYMMNSRAKNTGWRLDYFLVSERLRPKLADCLIRSEVFGSDHCPLTLLLEKP